jgi:tetratricopeptide (TPR) repeat protein
MSPGRGSSPARLNFSIRCREAVRLKPDDADSHADLVHLLVHKKDQLRTAIAEFNEAFRLEPRNNIIHLDAAYDLYLAGKIPQALVVAQHASDLDPGIPIPHIFLASLLEKQGKADLAFAEYRQAFLLEAPNQKNSLFVLNACMKKTGKTPTSPASATPSPWPGSPRRNGKPGGPSGARWTP